MIKDWIRNRYTDQTIEQITSPIAKIVSKLEKKLSAHNTSVEIHNAAADYHAKSVIIHTGEADRVRRAITKYNEFVF